MAQYINLIIGYLTSLVRPAPRPELPLLSYNSKVLKDRIHTAQDKLFELRSETSWQVLREVIELASNVQILEINRTGGKDFAVHQGRLQALQDLVSFIDESIDSVRYERRNADQAQVRGERPIAFQQRQSRKTANRAGSAV